MCVVVTRRTDRVSLGCVNRMTGSGASAPTYLLIEWPFRVVGETTGCNQVCRAGLHRGGRLTPGRGFFDRATPGRVTGWRPRNPAPERKAEPIHEAEANSEILNKPEPPRISK
jgi:hypothetical protein